MKSKISFFNKTIFKKNLTLYWPVWVLYTVVLVFAQPMAFWSNCYYSEYVDQYTYQDKLRGFIDVISLDFHIYVIAYVALVSGMALFHYLYNAKSANMMHAFPVDRKQLFCTNVLSEIFFLVVPQTISSILLAIVAVSNGVTEVYYVLYWWLLVAGTDIVAVAIVTFCAMFTGHIMALPIYTIVVNYFSFFVYTLIYVVVSLFGFGISNLGNKADRIVALFSPTECFRYNVGLIAKFDEARTCTGALVRGVNVLAIYLLVAAVLYVAAFFTYKKRHVEQAGEFITVGWVKPIFRFGIALAGGFWGSILIREFLRSIGVGCDMTTFVILLILFGVIFFFIADMLLHKSFHVFKKNNWKHCGICMAAMVITFFGILGIGRQMEDYQPKLDEIKYATINWGYQITLEGEAVAKVLEIQKVILENKDICMEAAEGRMEQCAYVYISYELKDGEYIYRNYQLPAGYEEIDTVLNEIAEMEMDADNYLSYLFVKNYEEIEEFNEGWFEANFVNTSSAGDDEYYWNTIYFSPEQSRDLYYAIIADVKAGNLMKYNVQNHWVETEKVEEWKNYCDVYIGLQFKNPNEENETHVVTDEFYYTYYDGAYAEESINTETWYSAHVTIGPDCENVINKLIEIGTIRSAEDIEWGLEFEK